MSGDGEPEDERLPAQVAGLDDSDRDAVLHPVSSGNVFEETFERLASVIKLGLIPPGGRLPPERELAERLRVSRSTVREAIRGLQLGGLVETRRGRTGGNFVVSRAQPVTEHEARSVARRMGAELVDALEFRRIVEPAAARLAAERGAAGAHRILDGLVEQLVANHDRTYRAGDVRLHLAIAELSRVRSLRAAVADVQLRLSDLLAQIPLLDEAFIHADAQHRGIVEAIAAGRASAAAKRMLEHVEATEQLLRGFLD